MTWEPKTLAEIATVSSGQSAPQETNAFSEYGTPFIRAGSLEFLIKGKGLSQCEKISEEKARAHRLKLFPKGTIVFAKSGMSAKLARVYQLEEPAYVVSHLATVIPKGMVSSAFLKHWFDKNPPSRLIPNEAYPSIRISEIERLKIPLPPLEEQKRIAAILDKADAIRKKRQQAIELADQFLRSAFLDMFGDPITNPKGWPTSIMKDCIADISSGWSAKGEEKERGKGEWGVLKISAVTSGRFRPAEYKVVGSIEPGKKIIVPKKGDLLFSRANTRELVAATCLVEEDCERLFLPDKLWRLTVNDDMKSEYLRYLLAHPRYRSYLTRQATGTSGSMLNVSRQKLMSMKLPQPPIEVQQAFSDLVWKTYQLQKTNANSAEKMTSQFNSLSQRAFRGEL